MSSINHAAILNDYRMDTCRSEFLLVCRLHLYVFVEKTLPDIGRSHQDPK